MATRIGVDIGGTFTDLVFYDEESGETLEGKVLTVPSAPEEGVVEAVRQHVPLEKLARARYFLHGTTVGLNALLERRGAKVGLITTEGFRDVLEIRRGDRAEMYNLFWRQPEPLVPRHRRLGVPERVMTTGAVYRPLDEAAVLAAAKQLMAENVDSIAVCLINAFANPAHELRIEDLLREAGFAGGVSLSHRISGEFREYERTSTTVIDAFVRGRMANYLQRLDGRLRALGFTGTSLITRSGSGSMTFTEAEARPFETIMSGPVGGAHGASELARALGLEALITADVGGTSFDTALVLDGAPQVLYQGEVDGMPVQTPWVDVRSIGSGGGSIAHIDLGGLMRVGPRSAGAVPGPAAYGRGGTEPAMTDAAAYLGMLGPGVLASGITLDVAAATGALETVAARLGQDVETTAIGVMRIAAAAMAGAMREITVEQGLDPRDMVLLPFGGAGPLMAVLLAEELRMKRIVIPPFAGNFSAWGLLGADMVQSSARTRVTDLDEKGVAEAEELLHTLFTEIESRADFTGAERSAKLDLRYKGQEHTLSVEVPLAGQHIDQTAEEIGSAFVADYERTFASRLPAAIEIVAVRATCRVRLPERRQLGGVAPAQADAAGPDTVDAYSFALGRRVPFKVVPRGAIADELKGPAVVTEATSTLYLDSGWTARPGAHGELVLAKEA
ncbi:MAG TPA: hydantoinase/oxoprolinase family protein [Devosiaceae bacterium]|nr:hydantoinase/oxoprolinase family protein [Devosiaceae bacterium]